MDKIKNHCQLLNNIIEHFSQPFGVGYPDGSLGLTNKAFEDLTGYTRKELKNMKWSEDLTPPEYHEMELKKLKELEITEIPVKYEKEYIRKDGSRVPVELLVHIIKNDDGSTNFYYTFLTNITERKLSEKEFYLSTEFLRIVNESVGTKELIKASVTFFKQQSTCEAVGIRLRKGEDYPYYESRGFPEEFLLLENQLCDRDKDNNLIRDRDGNVLIECMCGNVICGRTDPSKTFFTYKGSFWTNNTTELLLNTTEEDRQGHTRNRCNTEGYESVALIPLKLGEQRLGLLQLNDRKKGMFSSKQIALWERLANYLSIALAKFLAEETLQESEERYRELFNNANDMISLNLIKDNGMPGKFIDINDVGIKRLGYTRDEFLNMTPADIVVEDKQSSILNNAYNIADKKRVEFEIIHKTKDGKRIPVEISNHMFEFRGKKVALAISRDITERKYSEEALMVSEEKYRTLFEEDPDYTILLNEDGTIRDVNYSTVKLAGLPKKELIGKNFSELKFIRPEDMPVYKSKIKSLLNEGYREHFESQFVDKIGNIHSALIHLKAVKKNEKIDYILAIATDITELKLAENEIKSSLKEKDILIQEIHHRVKNNMQIITSLLNLQTQYVDEKDAVDVLKESQNRVKSMAMIHEKLYMSEDWIHINFDSYINGLVSNLFYSYNVKKSKINPTIQIENILLNIETAVPCGLIISELISNSLKYAFPNNMDGEIFVSLKSIDDKYELIISDNGIGLKEIDFNNLDSLGLLLVKNLTEQIEGKITIDRSNGTEFKIIFKELKYKDRL